MRNFTVRAASVLAGAAIAATVAGLVAPAANAATPQSSPFGNCDVAHTTPPTTPGDHGPQTCYQLIFGDGPGALGACIQLGNQLISQGHIGYYECGPNLRGATLLGFGH